MPEAVAVLYMSAKKRDMKPRIQAKFDDILCTDPENIEDKEIRCSLQSLPCFMAYFEQVGSISS